MSGHSMLRSGCGCLVSCLLIVVALVVGIMQMNSAPTPAHGPRPVPTSVRKAGAFPSTGTHRAVLRVAPRIPSIRAGNAPIANQVYACRSAAICSRKASRS
ncbi:MAG: hypothetical protein NVSMB65_13860 [Chloroflexota bacterium]